VSEREVKTYIFRLHRSGPSWGEDPAEFDWTGTAVGEPVRFDALQEEPGTWCARGPVLVTSPEQLEDPAWSVSLAGQDQVTIRGNVGTHLSKGEEFALPVTDIILFPVQPVTGKGALS
jgi:hypothetical protein